MRCRGHFPFAALLPTCGAARRASRFGPAPPPSQVEEWLSEALGGSGDVIWRRRKWQRKSEKGRVHETPLKRPHKSDTAAKSLPGIDRNGE